MRGYQQRVDDWLAALPARLAADSAAVQALAVPLKAFAAGATLAELNAEQEADSHVGADELQAWQAALAAALADEAPAQLIEGIVAQCAQARAAIAAAQRDSHAGQVALQKVLDALAPELKAAGKALEARHKQWLKLLEQAEKGLRARASKAWDGRAARDARRALLPADGRRDEAPTVRDEVLDALKQAVYFTHQVHWLHSRFPDAVFENVPGLCKAVTTDEIAANDYSLTPGRYVGVAAVSEDDDDENILEILSEIHLEISRLSTEGAFLAGRISRNFQCLTS